MIHNHRDNKYALFHGSVVIPHHELTFSILLHLIHFKIGKHSKTTAYALSILIFTPDNSWYRIFNTPLYCHLKDIWDSVSQGRQCSRISAISRLQKAKFADDAAPLDAGYTIAISRSVNVSETWTKLFLF